MQGHYSGEALTLGGDDRNNCPCLYFTPAGPESRYCGANGECRDPLKRCGLKCRRARPDAAQEVATQEPLAPPLRRLPFTLTYALASGERREVTLAGDVTVRLAEDGALIITHESLIRALTEIRPMEGA